jgi:hypothetical protein
VGDASPPRSALGYGCQSEEVALRRRMLAAELSLYEPSPLEALERVERARLDVRVEGDDTGRRTHT